VYADEQRVYLVVKLVNEHGGVLEAVVVVVTAAAEQYARVGRVVHAAWLEIPS
jgi:hypothetical protein